jgi:hypothetical protein
MALHLQQQVLNALQALLAAGGTAAGARVYLDREDPLPVSKLPAILIAEGEAGEDAESNEDLDGLEQRTLSVLVRCVVTHGTTAAADARALGLSVEKLIAASATLAALCGMGAHIANSRHVNSGEGEQRFAERVQTWQFIYLVHPATPDAIA